MALPVLFAFPTQAKRAMFLADVARACPAVQYAINLDPDTTQADRWIVAIRAEDTPCSR